MGLREVIENLIEEGDRKNLRPYKLAQLILDAVCAKHGHDWPRPSVYDAVNAIMVNAPSDVCQTCGAKKEKVDEEIEAGLRRWVEWGLGSGLVVSKTKVEVKHESA